VLLGFILYARQQLEAAIHAQQRLPSLHEHVSVFTGKRAKLIDGQLAQVEFADVFN